MTGHDETETETRTRGFSGVKPEGESSANRFQCPSSPPSRSRLVPFRLVARLGSPRSPRPVVLTDIFISIFPMGLYPSTTKSSVLNPSISPISSLVLANLRVGKSRGCLSS
jgi:hypothetical protein